MRIFVEVMAKEKITEKTSKKLMEDYLLTIVKQDSFEESYSTGFTLLRFGVVALSILILLAFFFWCLFAFTPVKYNIPGFPSEHIVRSDIQNRAKLDSLERKLSSNELYFNNLKAVLQGEEIEELKQGTLPNHNSGSFDYQISAEDSLARMEVEKQIQFELEPPKSASNSYLEGLVLFKPVEGVISDGINEEIGHFGIDISAAADTRVKAILEGTVIFSGFTANGGNEIYLQHENGLISIYKHNSALLKKAGDIVSAGESIAIVGNSGEHSSGTHLHFEIWQSGALLDPEDYFSF